jgi:hypothetical protein
MSFRPPFIDIQNNIIRSFIEGRQLALEKQRLAQERELRQQQLDQEKERIENEHQVAQGHLDLLSKANDLNRLVQGQALAEKGGETGIYPQGTQIERAQSYVPPAAEQEQVKTQAMPISTTLGMSPEDVKINIPGLGQFSGLTPEAQARRVGQLGILREAPALQKQKELQQEMLDRQMATELVRLESQNQLKKIEMDASENRANIAARGRMYAADKSYKARVDAASIMAKSKESKLTTRQTTDLENLNDIEDAIKGVQSSLGDPTDPKNNKWRSYFTGSTLDEIARSHPNLAKYVGKALPDELKDINSKFNTLDYTLSQKGKYSTNIQNIIARAGITGTRSQDPVTARNNLDALLHQIQLEKLNVVNKPLTEKTTTEKPVLTPDEIKNISKAEKHYYYDKQGNPIAAPQ